MKIGLTVNTKSWKQNWLERQFVRFEHWLIVKLSRDKYMPFVPTWAKDVSGLTPVFDQPIDFEYPSTHDDDCAFNCVTSQNFVWHLCVFRLWRQRNRIVFKVEDHGSELRGKGKRKHYWWVGKAQAYWLTAS